MRPVLAFTASSQLLTSRGIKFSRETDDLDSYKIARFIVNGVLAHVQAYEHSEKDRINIYIDVFGAEKAKVGPGRVVKLLMNHLRLDVAPIVWVNNAFEAELKVSGVSPIVPGIVAFKRKRIRAMRKAQTTKALKVANLKVGKAA